MLFYQKWIGRKLRPNQAVIIFPMDEVEEQSRYIRKYRNASIIMFLAFPFVMVLVFLLLSFFGLNEKLVIYFAIPYGIIFLATGIRWGYSSCPLCLNPMFRKGIFFYGFFKCVHCGYNLKDPKTSRNYSA